LKSQVSDKSLKVVFLCLLTILLSGCFQKEQNIDVKKYVSDISYQVSIAKDLKQTISMTIGVPTSDKHTTDELSKIVTKNIGGSIEGKTVSDKLFVTSSKTIDSFSSTLPVPQSSAFEIVHNEVTVKKSLLWRDYSVKTYLKFYSQPFEDNNLESPKPSASTEFDSYFDVLNNSIPVTYTLSFPGKISSSNASQKEKNQAIWNLRFGPDEVVDIQCSARQYLGWRIAIAVIILLIIIGAASDNKKESVSSSN